MFKTLKSFTKIFVALFFIFNVNAADPVLLGDFIPGVAGGASSSYHGIKLNNFLLVTIDNGLIGNELWKTDGTLAGTTLVKDINPGSATSNPYSFKLLNGVVIFIAENGVSGYELWRTDGTSAGTFLLKDINSFGDSNPNNMTVIGSTLYFSAESGPVGNELWKTDGTVEGTQLIRDIVISGSSNPEYFAEINGTLYFSARDGINGYELWKSDGTFSGTVMVKNINSGGNDSSPENLTTLGNKIIFQANDGINGDELWITDGTSVGTVLLKNIHPSDGSFPFQFKVVGNRVFFVANDGSTGNELWVSDGTSAGTYLVKDIIPGAPDSINYQEMEVLNNKLIFKAENDPWISDGTQAGTFKIKSVNGGLSTFIYSFYNFDGSIYFSASDNAAGKELWKTDGTEAGTFRLFDLQAGTGDSDPNILGYINGKIVFSATRSDVGTELWTLQIDNCPNDPAKSNPGVCGCGIRDADTNVNGVIDCLYTPEFNARVEKSIRDLRVLRLPRSNADKVLQIRKANALKSLVNGMLNYVIVNSSRIRVKPRTSLITLIKSARKSILKVVLLKRSSFTSSKKAADKVLKTIDSKLVL